MCVQNDLPAPFILLKESPSHHNNIYVIPYLVLEVAECMIDNEFLFFQVMPVLFNCSQHWLKLVIFSELNLVSIFTVYMTDPERDEIHLEMRLRSVQQSFSSSFNDCI